MGTILSLAAGRDLAPQARLFVELGRSPGQVPAALLDTVVADRSSGEIPQSVTQPIEKVVEG